MSWVGLQSLRPFVLHLPWNPVSYIYISRYKSKAFYYWHALKMALKLTRQIQRSILQHFCLSAHQSNLFLRQNQHFYAAYSSVSVDWGTGKHSHGHSLQRNNSTTFIWTLYQNTTNTTWRQHRSCNGPTQEELLYSKLSCTESFGHRIREHHPV